MLKDPTDLTKRKPRRLRGTPANKVVNFISFGIGGLYIGALAWFTSSDAEWILRLRDRIAEKLKGSGKQELRAKMFHDAEFNYIMHVLKARAEARAAGEEPSSRSEDDL